MNFKLQKTKSETGQAVFIVYPKNYDYGRGFSSLQKAFDYMNLIIRNL